MLQKKLSFDNKNFKMLFWGVSENFPEAEPEAGSFRPTLLLSRFDLSADLLMSLPRILNILKGFNNPFYRLRTEKSKIRVHFNVGPSEDKGTQKKLLMSEFLFCRHQLRWSIMKPPSISNVLTEQQVALRVCCPKATAFHPKPAEPSGETFIHIV